MITYSKIIVRSNGWFNDNEQIINENILKFFKQNLRRFPDGTYFIFNEFHGKIEHSILAAMESFPLTITALNYDSGILHVVLDSHETLKIDSELLYYQDDQTLWIPLKREIEDRLKNDSVKEFLDPGSQSDGIIPARLGSVAMASLQDYMHYDSKKDVFSIQWPDSEEKPLPVKSFETWKRIMKK